jgi:hypothetical protein
MDNCSCNQNQAPIINTTLAAGSVASPYYISCNITQKLCYKTCVEDTPVFNPRFSIIGFSKVGTAQYIATVHVEGIICYNPCGTCCCAAQQPLSANFTIPFYTTTTPLSVTVTQGATINTMAKGCQNCSRQFVSETPLTMAVSATAATNE